MAMTTSLLFTVAVLLGAGDHPLSKDRTGLQWQLPFSAAKAKAGNEKRLLMIKPVAFGTTADGGW